MKYAVFSTGSKQYLVSEGNNLSVEKLEVEKDNPVEFDKVLLIADGEKVEIGKPYLKAKVKASVVENLKSKKVKVFKYKAKTGYHKSQGHRQNLTKVKIDKIVGG